MNSCNEYVDPDISQAPGESILYTVDWPSRGLPDGVTISSQSYRPTGPTDYTISNTGLTDDDLMTTFKLTGGIPGTNYGIINAIVLSDGERMETTLIYECVLQNTRRKSTCV